VARDLIPPPSPAGRPAPDPAPHEPGAPEEGPPSAGAHPADPGPSPFRTRFGFLTGLLAGCAVAAAALFVVLLGHDEERVRATGADAGLAANWSPWRPRATTPISGAQEIAEKIGDAYEIARSKRLTQVTGGAIMLGTLPASVAIPAAGDRFQVLTGVGVQYTLAGTGQQGRLEGSKPSDRRRRLLRREALELSLYSFRYLPDVTMVVTLLPPAPRAEQVHRDRTDEDDLPALQKQALLFRPGDVRKQLERPLASTMATEAPAPGELRGAEAERIDKLTLPNLFTYEHIQQQDGSIYLVLGRPS
jgi:hypothetical protein